MITCSYHLILILLCWTRPRIRERQVLQLHVLHWEKCASTSVGDIPPEIATFSIPYFSYLSWFRVKAELGTFMSEMAMQKGVWSVWLETSCRLDKNSEWIAITVAKSTGCNLCAAIWVISYISFTASSTLFGKKIEVTYNMSPKTPILIILLASGTFPTRNLAGQLSALLTRRGGPIEVELGNNSNELPCRYLDDCRSCAYIYI